MRMTLIRSAMQAVTNLPETLVGRSGRHYVIKNILKQQPGFSELAVYRVECDEKSYVMRHLWEWKYKMLVQVADEFADVPSLRLPIDYNEKEFKVVFKYYRSTLLDLVWNQKDFPMLARKLILRRVAEALQAFHSRGWLHLDVKPDNILVDWTKHENVGYSIEHVVLGDFDWSLRPRDKYFNLPDGQLLGNFMWRAPEAHTGQGIGKASDVFSFGLVYLHSITNLELFDIKEAHIRDRQETAVFETLCRLFYHFGPLPQGLLEVIESESAKAMLRHASEMVEASRHEPPGAPFEGWDGLTPLDKDLLSKLLQLDPAARVTMDEVLEHPAWDEIRGLLETEEPENAIGKDTNVGAEVEKQDVVV